MNTIVQTTGVDSYSLNDKSEISNKILTNITRDLTMNSSKKEITLAIGLSVCNLNLPPKQE